MTKFHRISTTAIFLFYFAFFPYWIYNASLPQALVLFFVYWFISDVVQSLYLHRWAAHNLWSPPQWLQKTLGVIGVAANVGTPIGWAAWHRTHHQHNDTDRDPHSPTHKSWWYVTFWTKFHRVETRRAVDRMRDDFLMKLNKYEGHISIVVNLLVAAILIPTVGLQWFLTVWALPGALTIVIVNFFVNVLLHKDGEPQDNPLFWPLLFTECNHRKHHVGPMKLSYPGTWDISGSIVRKLGWT